MSFLQLTAGSYAAITPSDTLNQPRLIFGIYVGTAGSVRVSDYNNVIVDFKNCTAGSILPIKTNKVFSNGTDASDLVAFTDEAFLPIP
tara:strand:+ start:579 stop:842 length:264 start_codon:yes stop_codon:yes gene_type:complete